MNELDEPHPSDAEWQARRFPGGPLVFGVLSFVTAPLIIGMLLGAAGLRSGIDLWRSGLRRPVVALGIFANAIGLVTGVAAALLWGALLASILLGRDAIRESERWRGREVDLRGVVATDGSLLHVEGARTAIVFADLREPLCIDAMRAIADAHRSAPDCRIVLVNRADSESASGQELAVPEGWAATPASLRLPSPFDDLAILPTIVVLGPDGRVEKALVGVHPAEDVVKLLRGDAALESRKAEEAP